MRELKTRRGRSNCDLHFLISDELLKEALGHSYCPAHLLSGSTIIEKVTDGQVCQHLLLLKFTA